jgi:hypothetical protein
MGVARTLRWVGPIALLLFCACQKSHVFADGHTIEIAQDHNYWFRWIMLGVCVLFALTMIGLAFAGKGLRVGIYALPFALAPILLYPGTTKPSTRSKQAIDAYQAKLDAAGGISWKVAAEEAPELAAALRKRLRTDMKKFMATNLPRLANARADLTPKLQALKHAGVVTHADLVARAKKGDEAAKTALTELRSAARLERAVDEANQLNKELAGLTGILDKMSELARSKKPPQGKDARPYAAALERAKKLTTQKLPDPEADPADYPRKLYEKIVGPPPAEMSP